MTLHSLHGLEKGDYTVIAPVNLGQCLPREVVATQVVHVTDEAFASSVVGLLRVRLVWFLDHTQHQGGGGFGANNTKENPSVVTETLQDDHVNWTRYRTTT